MYMHLAGSLNTWEDISQHYDRIEDIPPTDRLLDAGSKANGTLH